MATARARFMAMACIAGYAQIHNAWSAPGLNLATDPAVARRVADTPTATAVARIPLRYGMAADRQISDGSRPVVIEGVATTLRKRLRAEREIDMRVGGGYGRYAPLQPVLPVIEADERTNAIIIRDSLSELAADAELVKAIDVKRDTLQIDVHAIDIDRPAFARIARDWAGEDADVSAGSSVLHWHSAVLEDGGKDLLERLANEDNARPVIERALSAISGSTASIERSRYEGKGLDPSLSDGGVAQTWRLTVRPINVDEQGQARVRLNVVGNALERAQATLADGQAMTVWFGLDLNDPGLARIRIFVLAPRRERITTKETNEASSTLERTDAGREQ